MIIANENGRVEFDYKSDLNDEEGDEAYLPSFFDGSVIELKMIEAARKGGGQKLMEAFLASPEVAQAKLIFLDCSPLFQTGDEAQTMQKLHDFYARFGFVGKSTNGYSRMWRIQALPATAKECFSQGFDGDNDFHAVLAGAFKASAPNNNRTATGTSPRMG